jgi:two-component system CheB/CheR fusion protein
MWNRKAREMWGLREDEVRRQPVLNLDIGLPIERLKDSLRSVLREAVRTDTVVLPAHDRKGKAFDCRVAVSPLHGSGNKVTGLILTMEAAVAE